ncbi:MAG TPA: hypothetical protein VGD69_30600 [Herpetosiphonaceae bacterium]
MPRRGPPSDDPIERFELKWRDDAMLKQLREEAGLRGVTLQQHIYDIVRARWLWQQGKTIDPFWIPASTPGAAPSQGSQEGELPDPETTPAAKAAASVWVDPE